MVKTESIYDQLFSNVLKIHHSNANKHNKQVTRPVSDSIKVECAGHDLFFKDRKWSLSKFFDELLMTVSYKDNYSLIPAKGQYNP